MRCLPGPHGDFRSRAHRGAALALCALIFCQSLTAPLARVVMGLGDAAVAKHHRAEALNSQRTKPAPRDGRGDDAVRKRYQRELLVGWADRSGLDLVLPLVRTLAAQPAPQWDAPGAMAPVLDIAVFDVRPLAPEGLDSPRASSLSATFSAGSDPPRRRLIRLCRLQISPPAA